MRMRWEEGFEISVHAREGDVTISANREGDVTISANREGLLSLANILMDLADEQSGAHIHLDENNSLEEGSAELIIERVG